MLRVIDDWTLEGPDCAPALPQLEVGVAEVGGELAVRLDKDPPPGPDGRRYSPYKSAHATHRYLGCGCGLAEGGNRGGALPIPATPSSDARPKPKGQLEVLPPSPHRPPPPLPRPGR